MKVRNTMCRSPSPRYSNRAPGLPATTPRWGRLTQQSRGLRSLLFKAVRGRHLTQAVRGHHDRVSGKVTEWARKSTGIALPPVSALKRKKVRKCLLEVGVA